MYSQLYLLQQKKKTRGAKYRRNQKQACKGFFTMKTHRMCLIPPVTSFDNMYTMLSIRKAPYSVFWSHRYSLLSRYQNSRLPKGKQVLSINYIVQFRHSESFLSILGILRTLPDSKFPDTSQEPTLQARPSKNSSLKPAMLTLFCTSSHTLRTQTSMSVFLSTMTLVFIPVSSNI